VSNSTEWLKTAATPIDTDQMNEGRMGTNWGMRRLRKAAHTGHKYNTFLGTNHTFAMLITYLMLQIGVTLSGVTNGAMFGLFSLGMFFPWANTKVKRHAETTEGAKVYSVTM
jgi:hypothetical protein